MFKISIFSFREIGEIFPPANLLRKILHAGNISKCESNLKRIITVLLNCDKHISCFIKHSDESINNRNCILIMLAK